MEIPDFFLHYSQHKDWIIRLEFWIVVIFFFTLSTLFTLSIVFIWVRQAVDNYSQRKYQKFSQTLTHLLIEWMDNKHIKQELNFAFWDRRILQRALIEHIYNLKGAERDFFVSLYARNGFVKADLKKLKSRSWAHRLQAAANLFVIRLDQVVDALKVASFDKNHMVAISALYTLSELDFPQKFQFLLESFKGPIAERGDLLLEITYNMGSRNPQNLVELLKNTQFSSSVNISIIKSIGTLKIIEGTHELTRLLESPSSNPMIKAECIRSLGYLGSPAAIPIIRQFLHSKIPLVLQNTIMALKRLDDLESLNEVKKLALHETFEVRSAVFQFERGLFE